MTGEVGSDRWYAAGSEEEGRRPTAKECGCPGKAGKGKEIRISPELSRRKSNLPDTLTLAK